MQIYLVLLYYHRGMCTVVLLILIQYCRSKNQLYHSAILLLLYMYIIVLLLFMFLSQNKEMCLCFSVVIHITFVVCRREERYVFTLYITYM